MTMERLQRLEDLFYKAEGLNGEERSLFFQGITASDPSILEDARCMLRAMDDNDSLPGAQTLREILYSQMKEELPDKIGFCYILDLLGEGGMGRVFLAWQEEPLARKVALKVLKTPIASSMSTRFEFEAEALARLNHPTVAKVHDVGKAENGAAFFTMEYFPGLPITRFCNQMKLNIEERIQLFLEVCNGIEHIHHKGLIHRDLKPSNILAMRQGSQNQVKIIDFGIARGLSAPFSAATLAEGPGAILGTLAYMSPEQAQGQDLELDTRSDIYSAAAVLYEMLCGRPPLDREKLASLPLEEALGQIRTAVPETPDQVVLTAESVGGGPQSSWSPLLKGEVSWILSKALAKEQNFRYTSISEFAEDLKRHLSGQPVSAGPVSRLYYVRKFIQRHSLTVLFAGIALLALLGGTAFSTWSFWNMRKARDLAVTESGRYQVLNNFFIEVLSSPNPYQKRNRNIKLIDALDEIGRVASKELKGQPYILSDIFKTLGETFMGLGENGKSEASLKKALAISKSNFGPDHLVLLLGICRKQHKMQLAIGFEWRELKGFHVHLNRNEKF